MNGTISSILVGAVLFLLVAGAAWALFTGLRLRAGAGVAREEGASLRALVASAPMQALVVRIDGRLEMPDRLADWLGLAARPRYLPELGGSGAGLSAADLSALTAAVTAVQRAGRPFELSLSVQGSTRSLVLRGQRAPAELQAPGGVLVWVFDASEGEAQRRQVAEEARAANEAFAALSGLIEAAPLPMWYRDADLRLAMVNSAYVEAVEARDAADVISRGLELFEGDQGGALASALAARDAGRPRAAEMPATIRGQRRMMRVVDVPLPEGIAGFALDVEEAEQARGALKRFGDAQRVMLDRLSAGVAQFGPDRSLAFCNQPFRRMFAVRDEWLAERPDFDGLVERMREAGRLPEVRDFPGWKAERRGWFLSAAGGAEENWHLTDGAHIRVLAQATPDGGLLLVFEDRTEQVQLASARDTLLRVRTATFDNLFEALGVFAADGRLQIWNSRFRDLWGLDEALLVTHPRVDALAELIGPKLVHKARAGLIVDLVRAATTERRQRGGRVALADGRHLEFAAVPLPDGNALFTMLDISDSRRIEQALRDRNEALEAADRIKTAFVASMSYELRTPLTSIAGFAEMLDGGYAGKLTPDGAAYVAAILDSTDRLAMLVDEVLELADATGEGMALDLAEVEIGPVARAATGAITALARRRQVELAVEILASGGRIAGDGKRLQQVVEHLLRRSASATATGGRILIHVDGNAKAARIIVSDDGEALDTDTGDAATPRGLGLPLARRIVEAHGGTIELVSEPGQGNLATVTLPRRQAK